MEFLINDEYRRISKWPTSSKATIHVWAMCHRSWVPEARDTGSVLTSVLHDLLCVWAQQRCVDSQYFDPLSVPNFLWNLHYILSAPLHIDRSAVQSVGLYRSAVRIAWYIYVLPSQTLTWGTYLLFCCYQTNQQSTIYYCCTILLYVDTQGDRQSVYIMFFFSFFSTVIGE